MFQGWRLKVREAEEAYRHGRLDEAEKLLSQDNLTQFLPAQRLSAKVAGGMAKRARHRVANGDSTAGWRDLDTAQSLVGETDTLLATRQEFIELALREAEASLANGDAAGAIARLEKLERRYIICEKSRTLKEVARRLESARNLSLRGKFADAESQLDSAATLRPKLTFIQQLQAECRRKLGKARDVTERLHRAMAKGKWSNVLTLADRLLALAPESRLAADARKRAWREVQASSPDLGKTRTWAPSSGNNGEGLGQTSDRGTNVSKADLGPRFLLWVDAVGGYLVCLSDTVVLGQAIPGNQVAVPILGDVSRQHAKVQRQGEGYLLEPMSSVRICGTKVDEKTLLSDGDEIELGDGVRIRFRQPHALSATARLEFVSRHRTQPSADAVLLMAESCVLGPNWQNHVVCREWADDAVLYRQDDDLYCRAMESLEIDGKLCDGRGQIELNSRVVGDNFSMTLEQI